MSFHFWTCLQECLFCFSKPFNKLWILFNLSPLSNHQQQTLNLINDVADIYNLESIPDVANHDANDVEDIQDDFSNYPIYCGEGALCTGNIMLNHEEPGDF